MRAAMGNQGRTKSRRTERAPADGVVSATNNVGPGAGVCIRDITRANVRIQRAPKAVRWNGGLETQAYALRRNSCQQML